MGQFWRNLILVTTDVPAFRPGRPRALSIWMRRFLVALPLAVLVLAGCASAGSLGDAAGGPAAPGGSVTAPARLVLPAPTVPGQAGGGAAGNAVGSGLPQPPNSSGAAPGPAAPLAPRGGGLLPRFPNPNPGTWSGCMGLPPGGTTARLCELK